MNNIKELERLIEEMLLWGKEVSTSMNDGPLQLEKQLVKLYHLYFDLPDLSDDSDYSHPPVFPNSYEETLKLNFPNFGYYNVCLNPKGLLTQYENGVGDATDDIRDILRELWDIDFYFKHTTPENAIFYFKLAFYSHLRFHVKNLLFYIEEQ